MVKCQINYSTPLHNFGFSSSHSTGIHQEKTHSGLPPEPSL
jgi:hypothetical protein